MILIKSIKWLASKKVIAEVYGEDVDDLGTTIGDLTIAPGSKAYTGDGKFYVLNSTEWTAVSSSGSEELPDSKGVEF